jgi:hypothetical protein
VRHVGPRPTLAEQVQCILTDAARQPLMRSVQLSGRSHLENLSKFAIDGWV